LTRAQLALQNHQILPFLAEGRREVLNVLGGA
jgi:hypothetical protein